MKYYYQFDLPRLQEIQTVLYNKYQDSFTPMSPAAFLVDWNAENFPVLYEEMIKIIKLPIVRARFFITPPHRSLDVHADGKSIKKNIFAINIPIKCAADNHYQIWYDYDGEIKKLLNQKYTDFNLPADVSRLKEVDRVIVTKPTIVQIGTFHGVENHTDQHRVILSLRFNRTLPGQETMSIDKIIDL
jgi:hypothetical protein